MRLASILTVLLLGVLLVPGGALADGDPASDVLLGENVFYPYTPAVSGQVQKTLDAETVAAKRAGFPIKVALIASPIDLGVIPDLFGKPQQYADFLDQEISFQRRQPLLVVMAAGYGAQGFTGPAKLAVSGLRAPAGKTSTDLAQAAIVAVSKLASVSGHPVKGVPGIPATSGGDGSSSSAPIVIGLAVAAVLVAAALVALRRRHAVGPAR
jgi:MYXO-CTERM domain-containing protein